MVKSYPTYQQMAIQHGGQLTYLELLQTAEWRQCRNAILLRDRYTCSVCAGRETWMMPHSGTGRVEPHEVNIPDTCRKRRWQMQVGHTSIDMSVLYEPDISYRPVSHSRRMHVHHRLYIYGRLPWQYSHRHLITMCEHCHHQWHQTKQVKVYRPTDDGYCEERVTPCRRCSGSGRLPQYNHVHLGICFRCWGACFEEWITPTMRQRSRRVYETWTNN